MPSEDTTRRRVFALETTLDVYERAAVMSMETVGPTALPVQFMLTCLRDAARDSLNEQKALLPKVRPRSTVKEIDEQMTKFLEGVVGAVEANSFEKLCLWQDYHEERKKPWVEGRSGLCEIVGDINGMPVNVSLYVDVVDGHRILFYDAVSAVVDHRLVLQWLQETLPKSAMRPDGFPNKVDAMNFYNVFPRK